MTHITAVITFVEKLVERRKAVVYIALSVDGFIAGPENDISFLSIVQAEGEDYGYSSFIKSIDTVVLGRKTYDWVMTQVNEFPHADKESYIITRSPKQSFGKTHFYSSDPALLITLLKHSAGGNIFIDGGAEIIQYLLKKKLIDEVYLSFIPVMLGQGFRLFEGDLPRQSLSLLETKQFASGLVQQHYAILHQ